MMLWMQPLRRYLEFFGRGRPAEYRQFSCVPAAAAIGSVNNSANRNVCARRRPDFARPT